jgi:predicted PurR-regulated permease PerM
MRTNPIPPARQALAAGREPPPAAAGDRARIGAAGLSVALVGLGAIAFFYWARAVVMPIFLATMATMVLRPFMRWASLLRIPTALAAAIVFCCSVAALGVGFFEVGQPALRWMNEAPQHMAELRHRAQTHFPRAGRVSRALAAISDLGATDAEKAKAQIQTPTVEVRDEHVATSILSWTGTVLAGVCEVLILVYLLLASGDLFLHKLVRLMPTLRDKKRAVEISHAIQQAISKYLCAVSLINICLGALVGLGLHFMGMPNPGMWGLLVALVNFVPYFGPVVGVILLAAAGLLTFNSLGHIIQPPLWYLLLHLFEANLVTPVLLGRRFTINPVAIFISLMFWLWLWGVPGALLAVPILVSVKIVCDHIPSATYVSELIGR